MCRCDSVCVACVCYECMDVSCACDGLCVCVCVCVCVYTYNGKAIVAIQYNEMQRVEVRSQTCTLA